MAGHGRLPSSSAGPRQLGFVFAGVAQNNGICSSRFELGLNPTNHFDDPTWDKRNTAGGPSTSSLHLLPSITNTSIFRQPLGPISGNSSFLPFPCVARYNASASASYIPGPQSSRSHPEYKPDWNIAGTSASHTSTPLQSTTTTTTTTIISHPHPLPMNFPLKREFSPDIPIDDDRAMPFPPIKLPRILECGNPKKKGAKRKYKCRLCTTTFIAESRWEMRRHNESLGHKPLRHACETPGCDKTFGRLDAVKRHMKKTHLKK